MAEKRLVSRAESVGVESSDDKNQLFSALGAFSRICGAREAASSYTPREWDCLVSSKWFNNHGNFFTAAKRCIQLYKPYYSAIDLQ